jgi:hypothetical protein
VRLLPYRFFAVASIKSCDWTGVDIYSADSRKEHVPVVPVVPVCAVKDFFCKPFW